MLKKRFVLAALRIQNYEEILNATLLSLLDELYEPQLVARLLKKKDLNGYSSLDLIAKLKLYSVLQSKVADRIIRLSWSSKIDSSASIMDIATTYKIFKNTNFSQAEDYELKYMRFWRRGSNAEEPLPHILNFIVWKNSMLVRYFVEMLAYSIQVIALTYFISKFNKDMHIMEKDAHHLEELKAKENLTLADMLDIEKTSEHMGHEIILAVTELNEAMDIGIISLTFPL